MRCFTSVWLALMVTWSDQISSGCLVDSLGLLAGSIGHMGAIIAYALLHFSLGCIDGYLVGSRIFGLFGRLFRAVGWFNRSYVCYYTICGASLLSGLHWWLLGLIRCLRVAWSILSRSWLVQMYYCVYYALRSDLFRSGLDWWLLGQIRYLRAVWSVLSGSGVD